ncbi:alpha/beta fold hydrolase [Gallaecimonas sp. GXIMD4217]|uniref:alpha/beta fold hydrolase n=1 Tax=Gallaecimonas sp. GXIMD4217 TaxID=3131927 RepID=UPI00311B381B
MSVHTHTLVLAHGAGAGLDHPFMQAMARGLEAEGIKVVLFDFPYMQRAKAENKKRPPDRMPVLLDAMRAVIDATEGPLFLGGKSMGSRVALTLAKELGERCRGALALGYPFHPPGKPERLRLEPFEGLAKPTLILQGERDTFGRRDEVDGYPLPANVSLHYLLDGDHSFKPRKASGRSEADNLDEAVARMAAFIREHGR